MAVGKKATARSVLKACAKPDHIFGTIEKFKKDPFAVRAIVMAQSACHQKLVHLWPWAASLARHSVLHAKLGQGGPGKNALEEQQLSLVWPLLLVQLQGARVCVCCSRKKVVTAPCAPQDSLRVFNDIGTSIPT